MSVEETLKDRDSKYGDFRSTAIEAQRLKATFKVDAQSFLSPVQREVLDMIATKLARILTGDPNHADSWHDIAGYAMLAEQDINSKPMTATEVVERTKVATTIYDEVLDPHAQPPVDNDHVAPGCEKFTDDEIAANADGGSNVVPMESNITSAKSFV